MGQKVHPYGFRLGFNKPWRSRWFSKQNYATLLQEDQELKDSLREQLKSAGISSIRVSTENWILCGSRAIASDTFDYAPASALQRRTSSPAGSSAPPFSRAQSSRSQ